MKYQQHVECLHKKFKRVFKTTSIRAMKNAIRLGRDEIYITHTKTINKKKYLRIFSRTKTPRF